MVTITGEANDKQRTADWYKDRMGRFSCSNFYRLMTEPKGGSNMDIYLAESKILEKYRVELEAMPMRLKNGDISKNYTNKKESISKQEIVVNALIKIKHEIILSIGATTYVNECVAERITGVQAKDDFTSKFTDWGIQYEPISKAIYSEVFGFKIIDSDYISYDFNSGGSPDGLIGDDGIVEVKCPFTITSHLEHKLYELIEKPEYYWQCIGYLLITERQWIDFVSYHPAYPGKLQMVCKRLKRDDVLNDIDRLKLKLIQAEKEFNLLVDSLI